MRVILANEVPDSENGSDTQGIGESSWQSTSDSVEPNDPIAIQYNVDISEGRSLPNVLKRISNIVAQKNVVNIIHYLHPIHHLVIVLYWNPGV